MRFRMDGAGIVGTCYLTEHVLTKDGQWLRLFGHYADRLVQEDARLRFAERRFSELSQSVLPAPAATLPHPDRVGLPGE